MNSYADQIKSALTARQVAEKYGFEINRSGYIACPFHAELTPSLKLYDQIGEGFCCFGCQVSGSVIDFVMHVFNIPFAAACVRLNSDFGLNIFSSSRASLREAAALKKAITEKQQERERFVQEYTNKTNEYRALWKAYIHEAPTAPGDEISDNYAKACKRLPILDYWFEEHPF